MTVHQREQIQQLWDAALGAVSGQHAVRTALSEAESSTFDFIVAVGKAAADMCFGALDYLDVEGRALVVTKYGHGLEAVTADPRVSVIESAHPIPDEASLRAGKTLCQWIDSMPADARLLMLVSGGASALAEALPEGMTLGELQQKNNEWIRNGLDIAKINAQRKKLSLIKGGKLLQRFKGAEVKVLAISDVEGDSLETIGSGIGSPHLCQTMQHARVIASNAIAREAVEAKAGELGLPLKFNQETLYADVFELAPKIASELLQGLPGVYLWGGEPTIMLPEKPGQGGRNQSLALALAQEIRGREDITILVAGTDGTDGPTDAAGGLVDGLTADDPAQLQSALERADAGPYLAQRDALFKTGPTRTNVMDLVIAIVG